MANLNEVVLVTKQLVDFYVEKLLDRDRYSFICLVDSIVELDELTAQINHDAGARDILYNLHLIDCETYHSIGELLVEFTNDLKDQYDHVAWLDSLDDSEECSVSND